MSVFGICCVSVGRVYGLWAGSWEWLWRLVNDSSSMGYDSRWQDLGVCVRFSVGKLQCCLCWQGQPWEGVLIWVGDYWYVVQEGAPR